MVIFQKKKQRYRLSVIDLINFRENWLLFLGIWGEAKLILRIWGAKENIFREQMYFPLGSWGDQCIIFRDQGSTDPPPLGVLRIRLNYTIMHVHVLVPLYLLGDLPNGFVFKQVQTV